MKKKGVAFSLTMCKKVETIAIACSRSAGKMVSSHICGQYYFAHMLQLSLLLPSLVDEKTCTDASEGAGFPGFVSGEGRVYC